MLEAVEVGDRGFREMRRWLVEVVEGPQEMGLKAGLAGHHP